MIMKYNGEAFLMLYLAFAVVVIGFCMYRERARRVERENARKRRELARWEWSLEKRESELQKKSR